MSRFFSARPGQLKEIVEINIPREKRIWADMNNDPDFIAARDRILKSVREEVSVAKKSNASSLTQPGQITAFDRFMWRI